MTPIAELLRRWWEGAPRVATPAGLAFATSVTGRSIAWPLESHVLVAGSTGAGKSVTLRAMLRAAAERSDCAICAIDAKLVELIAWQARLSAPLATEPDDAAALLRVLVDELRARRKVLVEHDAVEWDTAWGPRIICAVDELAEIATKDTLPLIASIVRLGRALGIHLIGCTQRAGDDSISTIVRGQLDWRVGLRTRDVNESRLVCPTSVADLSTLPQHTMMWLPPAPHRVTLAKAEFIPAERVRGIAAATAHLRPSVPRLDELAGAR